MDQLLGVGQHPVPHLRLGPLAPNPLNAVDQSDAANQGTEGKAIVKKV